MTFDKVAGTKPGIEIWRIEKMEPVRIDPKFNGQFYSGDCYIVLRTEEKKGSGSFDQDIFFWLGKDSTQDEQGAAAFHTVNLDEVLGGKVVQHRELQGYESPKFSSSFPQGIHYMEGGIGTGFKHVDRDHYDPRLFQLDGKRIVRVQQVQLTADSLNEGDVFILDLGLKLIQWNGKDANKYEKIKGLEITSKIKDDERDGKAEIIVLDSGKETDEFWKPLGGKKPVKSAAAAASNSDAKSQPVLQLYRVSDASGKTQASLVAENKLEKSALNTSGVFLVFNGAEVFVWIGEKASKDDRKNAMRYGMDFLKDHNLPNQTQVTRVIESGETPSFKAQFFAFDPIKVVNALEYKAAAPRAVTNNVDDLYHRRAKEEEKMVGTDGKTDVWRVENRNKVAVPKEKLGVFFSGDSYIVLYSYKVNTKDKYIIYFWQGRDSSIESKGDSALFAKQMDDDLHHQAVQVRVVEGKEPNHFLALFKGNMVVHLGTYASVFKNRKDTESYDTTETALYQIHGSTDLNTRAAQVPAAAASLYSCDCFVLLTPQDMYIWYGEGCNPEEHKNALNTSKILQFSRSAHEVQEGREPDAFWTALGGKGDYTRTKALAGGAHDPRLFECHDYFSGLTVEEIFDFSQDDLVHDEVMLLDVYDEVFVWIGRDSTKQQRDVALQTALDYVKKAPDGRSPDTPVMKVMAGCEPPIFTCHFLGWDETQAADFTDPYLKKLGQVKKSGGAAPSERKAEVVTASDVGFKQGTFTLDQLKAGVDGIDASKKEQYLSADEFQKVFRMSKADFATLPAWKQGQKKKEAGLF